MKNLAFTDGILTIPARQVSDLSEWFGDEYHIRVKGIIEEGHIFGTKLRLEREISSVQGQNIIRLKDTVTNAGYKPPVPTQSCII